MKNKLDTGRISLGVCYYPEHWDPSMWREDLRRMKLLGIETARVAEFAWNKFEPREGEFSFDFFDAFMETALETGMRIIFCTPTATPPAWMSEKYPEILNADFDGRLIRHGHRRHCNLNSERYRFFVSRITEKLAEHYGKYSNIAAWQLDNEINCECDLYRSQSDNEAFRRYLQKRFGTLDALNEAIGAVFWNQTYTSWDEVHLPRRTNFGDRGNPHIALLERRFVSDTVTDFLKLQADIIRRHSSAPITTNGIFGHIDYERLVGGTLDFITYDNYPNFAYERSLDVSKENGLRDRNSSWSLTRARGISPVFGIMEQQSGPSGWTFSMEQPAPKPGQLRLWTLQAIAHGADYVGYFRWRTCRFGTEMYWHGILDYDNRPNRRSEELRRTYEDVLKLQGIHGSEYPAEAVLLKDYDNEWDGESDNWHGEADRISYDGWFRAFQKEHIPFDLLYINDETRAEELYKYKLAVYPHPAILTKKRAELLREFAARGGTVIFGCRTGYKDTDGGCVSEPLPGFAAPLCGAEIEEFTFLSPYDKEQYVTLGGRHVNAPCFNDILRITDGETVGEFERDYYSGKPAASVKRIGAGRVYYFGAAFAEDTAGAFIALTELVPPAGLGELCDIPESVELAVRGNCAFLLNYGAEPVEFPCRAELTDALSGRRYIDNIVIDGYDAAVIEIDRL